MEELRRHAWCEGMGAALDISLEAATIAEAPKPVVSEPEDPAQPMQSSLQLVIPDDLGTPTCRTGGGLACKLLFGVLSLEPRGLRMMPCCDGRLPPACNFDNLSRDMKPCRGSIAASRKAC